MKTPVLLLIASSIIGLTSISVTAAPLDFREVSLLVRSHESEPSIMADVRQRRFVRALTPAQEETLRSQGASESLIRSLNQSGLALPPTEAAAYEASRAAKSPASRPAPTFGTPRIEILDVGVGQPINLSPWGGPDCDLVFRAADIVETGRPEAQLVQAAGTGTSYATYRGVRVPGWEPIDPEYTSVTDYVFARPLHIDWANPRQVQGVPYNLYPVYSAGRAAIYFIGRSGSDSVKVAVVSRG